MVQRKSPPTADGGGIRPIIVGELFASLAANAVRGPISRVLTSTYEIFLQTAGLQDGASHCAKILNLGGVGPVRDLRGGGRRGWCEE
jgi:hypothetical protein